MEGTLKSLSIILTAALLMLGLDQVVKADGTQLIASDKLKTLSEGRSVGFYALDLETGKTYRYGEEDIDTRHAPWSTFKIPNYLIALESGVAANAAATRQWDKKKHPPLSFWPKIWKRDHTLDSAFKFSVVWYFKDVAADVGTDRYKDYLARFSYGNQTVPAASNDFWLGGDSLTISLREQVGFLFALRKGEIEINAGSLAALENASNLGTQTGYTLHAKTGAGRIASGPSKGTLEGWFVGWVDGPGAKDTVFAFYTTAPNYGAIKSFRQEFSEQALQDIGALPDGWTPSK
ncbi:class D beta-lactamase [Labrenzia sp. PHM005]|uniref:class D beta-lactamase n=1 Tax=Labrenzia sp. PHM005 TaxID=2590016 RepID=UPI00113FF903|nr:class D beta-lactamase [Labrenzia sp. PHM005]QDG78556.1 class D beta-lactamase [Labrenzia sp. PHM005]